MVIKSQSDVDVILKKLKLMLKKYTFSFIGLSSLLSLKMMSPN
jgi:hypothetical protein